MCQKPCYWKKRNPLQVAKYVVPENLSSAASYQRFSAFFMIAAWLISSKDLRLSCPDARSRHLMSNKPQTAPQNVSGLHHRTYVISIVYILNNLHQAPSSTILHGDFWMQGIHRSVLFEKRLPPHSGQRIFLGTFARNSYTLLLVISLELLTNNDIRYFILCYKSPYCQKTHYRLY